MMLLTSALYLPVPIIRLGGEKHCERKESSSRTHCHDPSLSVQMYNVFLAVPYFWQRQETAGKTASYASSSESHPDSKPEYSIQSLAHQPQVSPFVTIPVFYSPSKCSSSASFFFSSASFFLASSRSRVKSAAFFLGFLSSWVCPLPRPLPRSLL